MKKYILFLLFLSLSCGKNNYYGYIYDIDTKKPIEDVLVNDYLNKNKVSSNIDGYFKLKKSGDFSSVIIFSKNDYQIDTIKSIVIANGERQIERFKGEIIYLSNKNSHFKDSIKNLNK